jgi:hypothetical protein
MGRSKNGNTSFEQRSRWIRPAPRPVTVRRGHRVVKSARQPSEIRLRPAASLPPDCRGQGRDGLDFPRGPTSVNPPLRRVLTPVGYSASRAITRY